MYGLSKICLQLFEGMSSTCNTISDSWSAVDYKKRSSSLWRAFQHKLAYSVRTSQAVSLVMDMYCKDVVLHHALLQLSLVSQILQQEEEQQRQVEIEAEEAPRAKRKYRRRRIWVEKWLQKRMEQGAWQNLLPTLAHTNHKQFKNTLRMDEEMFLQLLER